MAQLFSLGHESYFEFFAFFAAKDFGDLDFAERKFVADLSRCSFAGSDADERELPRDLSAEIFVGWFMKIYATWHNNALEPTPVTPSVCREGSGCRQSPAAWLSFLR